jgi:hypothetical protein
MEVTQMAMNPATEDLCTALDRQRSALTGVINELEDEFNVLAHRLVDDSWSGPARWAFDGALDELRRHLTLTLEEFVDARKATTISLHQLGY